MKKLFLAASVALAASCMNPAQARDPDLVGLLALRTLYPVSCHLADYQSVPVYDSPGGLRVGQLVLDHPEYAQADPPNCGFQPRVMLQPEGLQTLRPVQSAQLNATQQALVVLAVQHSAGADWYLAKAGFSQVWLSSEDLGKTQSYFDLISALTTGIAKPTETCTPDGQCQPLSEQRLQVVEKAGEDRPDSCYKNAYDLDTSQGTFLTRLPGGRLVYRAKLALSLVPKYQGKLPDKLLVPVYDDTGKWTGFHAPYPCQP